MLLKIEGLKYAKSTYLNMGYYYIQLIESSSNLCKIIPPWLKYCYKSLPMVVSNSPEIFQHKMDCLFQGFEFIRAYIDKLLV